MRGMEPLWRELSTTHDLVIDDLSNLLVIRKLRFWNNMGCYV